MLQLHKTIISKHNQCLCCVFRARTVDEFKRITSSEARADAKEQSVKLPEQYKKFQKTFTKYALTNK